MKPWVHEFDPMQVYRNRAYSCSSLSDQMFNALNYSGLDAGTVHLSCTGCLDAIDSIPAGGVHGTVSRDGQWAYITPNYVQRDDLHLSPQERRERDARVKKIIDEILAEEEHEKSEDR